MHKIWAVVRREYLQSVRTKAFWIGTLALPLLMFVLFAVPLGLALVNPEQRKSLAVLDETGGLFGPLSRGLGDKRLSDGEPEFELEQVRAGEARDLQREVADGQIYGWMRLGPGLEEEDSFRLYRKNVGDHASARALESALQEAVVQLRLERSALPLEPDVLESLTRPVQLQSYQVTGAGAARRRGFLETYFATYVFVMLLYFMLYFYGFAVTRGILQEKSNRIMEVLLGSLSADQLMTGKIVGIGLVGLTQLAVYLVTAGLLRLVTLVRTDGAGAWVDAVSPKNLFFFSIFFLVGYFLFTSLFAIVGAVCNTEQEAQSLQMPVFACLLVPLITTIFFVQHPDSIAAAGLSLIPLFTPMLMFMRISVLTPPGWQILLSLVLSSATVFLLFRAAAKVFRIGTLMYGKRPSLREIWRWARG